MLPLNILRGFNLIIDDDKNTFLEIEEMKLPVIGDETDDHSPGGSFMTIDVPLGIEKLEAAIKLRGMDHAGKRLDR
ncbi:MAG: phage major tail tube protein [Tepidamorphaceae bacterium]